MLGIGFCLTIFNISLQDDTALDSDSDSLDNLSEMIQGTDPYIADSDGDGLPDGTEVDMGSDPLDEDDDTAPPPPQQAEIKLTSTYLA